MKIINRKSEELVFHTKRSYDRFFISVTNRYVLFTAAVTNFCGINDKQFIHFINDGDQWRFFINDDPDGFKPVEIDNKESVRPAYKINSSGLTNMILKSTGFQKQKRFSVLKTDNYQDRSPIFELSLKNVSTVIK